MRQLADLLDMSIVQKLAEANYVAGGMPIGIIDAFDGSILVKVGWQDICTKFHQANSLSEQRCRESSNFIKSKLFETEVYQCRCANGLRGIAIPIRVAEVHAATLFLGQFFYEGEVPDRPLFVNQARLFGYDEEAYLAALDQVPVFSRDKVDHILNYDKVLARFISELAERSLRNILDREALCESEERFRMIFDAVNDSIVIHELPSGNIVDINRRMCEMFGYTQEEARLLSIGDISTNIPPHTQSSALRWIAKAADYGPQTTEWHFKHKNGYLFWGEVNLRRAAIAGQERVLVTIRDISERKKAEEELRESARLLESKVAERTKELERESAERLRVVEELRERDRKLMLQSRQAAMGEMINNIAHQWRQPLNVLGLSIQDMQIRHELGDFDAEYLETAVNRGMKLIQHMSQTIDDFRYFFKPDKERELFDVARIIVRTIYLVEESMRHQEIKIHFEKQSDCSIYGYPNEFSQVILNMLFNSRDAFMERNLKEGQIAIRQRVEKSKMVVTVTDNAGGVPIAILDRIFDPYFSTKGPDKGTGVGLFMSKLIIEKNMNGRLSVCNVGDGAEFRIEV